MSLKDAFPSGAIGDSAATPPPSKKKAAALPLTREQESEAERLAAEIVGDEAAPIMVRDIFAGATEQAIDGLLQWLASMAEAASEIVVEEYNETLEEVKVVASYRLVPALQMTALQMRDVVHELKALGVSASSGSIDIGRVVQGFADSEEATARLFARLYIRKHERKYNRETVTDRIPHMADLTIAQMMGALYRFFTSNGLAPRGAIRGFLVRLGAQAVERLKIPITSIPGNQQTD
ncbi:MAG: hypothetical protein IPM61_16790 [Chlorobi bacterium]|nr:hypothetical protein [Chlorobiota bacterium]